METKIPSRVPLSLRDDILLCDLLQQSQSRATPLSWQVCKGEEKRSPTGQRPLTPSRRTKSWEQRGRPHTETNRVHEFNNRQVCLHTWAAHLLAVMLGLPRDRQGRRAGPVQGGEPRPGPGGVRGTRDAGASFPGSWGGAVRGMRTRAHPFRLSPLLTRRDSAQDVCVALTKSAAGYPTWVQLPAPLQRGTWYPKESGKEAVVNILITGWRVSLSLSENVCLD